MYRRGQKKTVYLVNFCIENTLDSRIVELHINKFYEILKRLEVDRVRVFTKKFGISSIDLIIFDEAHKMTEEEIKNSPRGIVNVYFYDDSQVFIRNEVGTRDNFLKYLTNVKEYELPSPVREPKQYLDFVKRILEGVKGNLGNFDFRIFDDNVFFEDKETANAVKELIKNPSNV